MNEEKCLGRQWLGPYMNFYLFYHIKESCICFYRHTARFMKSLAIAIFITYELVSDVEIINKTDLY